VKNGRAGDWRAGETGRSEERTTDGSGGERWNGSVLRT
jgi:hypothetical protein